MTEIPEPWATALVEAGMIDPRGREDRPSLNRLAEAAGVSTTTLTNLVTGRRKTSVGTLERVATALHLSPRLIAEWAGRSRAMVSAYDPPTEANLLNRRQRRALDELIRSMVEGDGSDGTERQKMRDADREGPGLSVEDIGGAPGTATPTPRATRDPGRKP